MKTWLDVFEVLPLFVGVTTASDSDGNTDTSQGLISFATSVDVCDGCDVEIVGRLSRQLLCRQQPVLQCLALGKLVDASSCPLDTPDLYSKVEFGLVASNSCTEEKRDLYCGRRLLVALDACAAERDDLCFK